MRMLTTLTSHYLLCNIFQNTKKWLPQWMYIQVYEKWYGVNGSIDVIIHCSVWLVWKWRKNGNIKVDSLWSNVD